MRQSIGKSSAASYPKTRALRAQARRRGLFGVLLGTLCLASCVTTPITGSQSFNLFSADQDVAMGAQAYTQILSENKLITSGAQVNRVRRVMDKLVAATGEDGRGYQWEVNLIDDPNVVNAFALPGGKMAVYTGMLAVCPTDDALAVVMGHEIGHVIARHGSQRMSLSSGADMILQAVDLNEFAGATQLLLGVAAKPYGRRYETESDHMGIIYMARAGYDPREAPAFWRRLDAGGGGEGTDAGFMASLSAFFSTHPSHATRVHDLEELVPEAMAERP